jgi:hypothetical protein
MTLDAIADRREQERFPIQRSVEMATSQAVGDCLDATILDFSEQGLRVSTKGLLNKGESITVHWGNRRLVGRVVHCCYEQSGTTAGIRLADAQ